MGLTYEIGKANASHAPHLAKLLVQASGGVIDALYQGLMGDMPTWQIVERRFYRAGTSGHFDNCFVAHDGETVLGGMHIHPMDDLPGDPPDNLIPEDRYWVADPFYHLDPSAKGTFHVHFVSVFEPYRGQGVGTALIGLARSEAALRGFRELSLTVFEQNKAAVDLYRRLGFREVARHPGARHEAVTFGGDLLMMVAPVQLSGG